MASTSWTWDESYGQHRMWAHQEQRWVLADGTRLPRAPLRGNGSQSVVASTSRKPYTEVASTSREPYTQVASTSRVPYTPVDTQRQDISDAVLATDQPSDDFGTTAFQPPQHTYSASPYASTSEVPYTPADTQGQAISTAALASDQPSYDFGATASQTPQHGYAASPYAQAAVQSSGPGTSQRVMTPEQEAEWATRASSSVNPKVAVITKDPGAEYMVYAIHGLQSNTRTWGGYKKGKPNGSLRWLDHLSEWLKGHGGAAVDVSLVGWNTQAQSTANIASDVRSAVRSLANTIVGLRGETPDSIALNERHGVQRQPQKVIIIGHSMGGILARALLGFMHAEVQANPHYTPFLRSVAGVILLASPSQGSALANVATPMVQGASRISGGMSVLFNPAHLQALKPSAQELESVTGEFDAYCAWYSGLHYAALKLAALRETRKTSGFRVVDAASGDIPETTKLVTNWQVQDLEGLNHVEVTKFSSMDDPRLRKILDQFLRMQRA